VRQNVNAGGVVVLVMNPRRKNLMPDNITIVDGRHLLAANWDRGHPWHRLGKRVTVDMSIEEALEYSMSDDWVYPVSLYDIESVMVQEGPDGRPFIYVDELEEAPDIVGIKSDVHKLMGHASPDYEIMQRRDILELAYDIVGLSKEDAHIDTIGNLGPRAEKFFVYIRVPDLVIDPNGIADTIERGLFVATSFNRTLPNIIGYSNIRVVCGNTLQMALDVGLQQAIRALHTKNAEERLRTAAAAIGYVGAVEQVVTQRAEEMLRMDGDKALITITDEFMPTPDDLGQTARTRRERQKGDLHILYDGPGNTNVAKVGRNGWAAYNAFAELTDHGRTVKGPRKSLDRSEGNVLPGQVANKKIKASELVLSVASN
jgi:phage/plasmid-like protein (TIGR03299 family)